jgi:hypothetical protein
VHWQPPPQALQRAAEMAPDPAVSAYGPDEGLPALREALRRKLKEENGLAGVSLVSLSSQCTALEFRRALGWLHAPAALKQHAQWPTASPRA